MFTEVINYFNHTWGYVELAGTIASIICVYLAVRQNIWTWFWGAIGVLLFGPLFFHYKLYSDASLQILFFLPMQALGWYWWTKKTDTGESLSVNVLSKEMFLLFAAIVLLASYLTGAYMSNMTDASFPYVDALTTWMSICAQLLMLKKFVESWYYWIAMDIIAIQVYFLKELYVVSGLYVIFLALAVYGCVSWRNARALQQGKVNV